MARPAGPSQVGENTCGSAYRPAADREGVGHGPDPLLFGPAGACNPIPIPVFSPACAREAETARLLSLAEEGLRRRGFGEGAIKRARKANRALIEAHLTGKEGQ